MANLTPLHVKGKKDLKKNIDQLLPKRSIQPTRDQMTSSQYSRVNTINSNQKHSKESISDRKRGTNPMLPYLPLSQTP